MVTSSLRRTIVVAVLATLPRIAGAHGDAALSNAFAAMHAPIAAMAQLQAASQRPAPQAPGLTVPADVWNKMRQIAITLGKHEPIPGSAALSYEFTKNVVAPAKDYMATHKVLVLGLPLDGTPRGRVKTGAALLSFEERKLLPGNAVSADIWKLEISSEGKLFKVVRWQILTQGGKTVDGPDVVMDLADPEVKSRFDEEVLYWSRF